jgi:uncharacterized small protein (DUF1192 family)
MSDDDKGLFGFDHTVLDDADLVFCEHGVNVVCDACRARIATLEAENARLRADLERVTGELDAANARVANLGENLDNVFAEAVAARRSLEEAVRLLGEQPAMCRGFSNPRWRYRGDMGPCTSKGCWACRAFAFVAAFLASHPTPEPKEPTT